MQSKATKLQLLITFVRCEDILACIGSITSIDRRTVKMTTFYVEY